nr:LOW QUALITY PROTEIN: alpha-(1,3)-fucosyltransferase C-like [Rhipicephalus microplus]
MFNWTMTYRRDSDVYLPYGRITPRLLTNATLAKRDLKTLWKSKNKTAVWLVSNCVTSGGRESFVSELRRHADVDVYGLCGDYKCPASRNDSCYRDFQQTYFFALAFENSICEDYVTEKFFNALRHDIIPVVFGGAKYSEIAPPHSYINALSFRSPEHLAKYLVRLSKNYTEYAAYFAWKEHFDVDADGGFCELCKKLHIDRQETSMYEDVRSWWFGKGGRCTSWPLVELNLPQVILRTQDGYSGTHTANNSASKTYLSA